MALTIGNRVENGPCPVIEDDVEFGAYGHVLGGVRVGKGAKIGALSLVLSDVKTSATTLEQGAAQSFCATLRPNNHNLSSMESTGARSPPRMESVAMATRN